VLGGKKVYDLAKVAKHPPYQPTTAAKHLLQANFNQRDDSGKASARRNGGKASSSEENPTTKCDPNDADEMKRRHAQK